MNAARGATIGRVPGLPAWRVYGCGCTLTRCHTERQARAWADAWNGGATEHDATLAARAADPTGWRYVADGRAYRPELWDTSVMEPPTATGQRRAES